VTGLRSLLALCIVYMAGAIAALYSLSKVSCSPSIPLSRYRMRYDSGRTVPGRQLAELAVATLCVLIPGDRVTTGRIRIRWCPAPMIR
jgi:hypothetical protein